MPVAADEMGLNEAALPGWLAQLRLGAAVPAELSGSLLIRELARRFTRPMIG